PRAALPLQLPAPPLRHQPQPQRRGHAPSPRPRPRQGRGHPWGRGLGVPRPPRVQPGLRPQPGALRGGAGHPPPCPRPPAPHRPVQRPQPRQRRRPRPAAGAGDAAGGGRPLPADAAGAGAGAAPALGGRRRGGPAGLGHRAAAGRLHRADRRVPQRRRHQRPRPRGLPPGAALGGAGPRGGGGPWGSAPSSAPPSPPPPPPWGLPRSCWCTWPPRPPSCRGGAAGAASTTAVATGRGSWGCWGWGPPPPPAARAAPLGPAGLALALLGLQAGALRAALPGGAPHGLCLPDQPGGHLQPCPTARPHGAGGNGTRGARPAVPGPSTRLLAQNLWPRPPEPGLGGDEDDDSSFGVLLGLSLPTASGVLWGCSRCGELRDAARSVPAGSLGAALATALGCIRPAAHGGTPKHLSAALLLGASVEGQLLRDKFGGSSAGDAGGGGRPPGPPPGCRWPGPCCRRGGPGCRRCWGAAGCCGGWPGPAPCPCPTRWAGGDCGHWRRRRRWLSWACCWAPWTCWRPSSP
ncbi:unnamed protein product, partial [Bubo scandiacus]